MALERRNAVGQDYTNNADGWSLGGGIIKRLFNLISGNVTMTAGNSNTYNFPAQSDDLVGRIELRRTQQILNNG